MTSREIMLVPTSKAQRFWIRWVCSSLRYWNIRKISQMFDFYLKSNDFLNFLCLMIEPWKIFGSQWALQGKRYCEKNFGAPKFGQVMWGFKEILRGECQKLMKIVKIKTIKWIQKRPTTLNVLQGLGFITDVCFISIHAYSDHESPKKMLRFALPKYLKLKNSEFRTTRPHKKTPYRHQRHLHRSTCATSFVYHPLGVYCKRSRRLWRGKFTRKMNLIWKKIVREFTFFLLKNTKADATKMHYHVSYSRPF